jgi:hypothetical protein
LSDPGLILSEASTSEGGEFAEHDSLKVKTLIVPKNSGIQTVVPMIYDALSTAEGMEARYRVFAIKRVKNRILGLESMSSEMGNMWKALTTTTNRSFVEQVNRGPSPSNTDKWLYGKKNFKNNPGTNRNDEVF